MAAKDYELVFEDIIHTVTGNEVEHIDDGSKPGMVDALIHHADGSVAALEFTTVTANAAMQMESFPIELEVPETPHWWDLRYPGVSLSRKEVEEHVPAFIRWLDQFDMDDAEKLGKLIQPTAEWHWFKRTGIRLRRFPGAMSGGRVDILQEGSGAAVDTYLEGLAYWVSNLQDDRLWTDHVAKLARSGYEDQHLAIRVHQSGMPDSLWLGMWDSREIRAPAPTGMGSLARLWLMTAYGTTIVSWSRSDGWASHQYRQKPEPLWELFEGHDSGDAR